MRASGRTRQQQVPADAPSGIREPLSTRNLAIAALCAIAVVFAIYSSSLNFQFILDDHRFTADPRIQSSGHLWDYFTNYVWAQFTGGPPSFYRPVFVLWMRINFVLCELSTWGWHFLSIAKHIAAAALLGLLSWRLLRDRVAALLAATLFALHPAQSESVAWVTVPDPLMSIGMIAALLLYLRYAGDDDKLVSVKHVKEKKLKKPTQSSVGWSLGAIAVYLAALFAKETAIILPAIIFAIALIGPRFNSSNSVREKRDGDSLTHELVSKLLYAFRQSLPILLVTLFYLALRYNALAGKLSARTQDLPVTTVIFSWPAILWFYVKTMVLPGHSYAFANPILIAGFSMRDVLLPLAGLACVSVLLVGGMFWAWRKGTRDLPRDEASRAHIALVIGASLLILPILPALNLNALNPGDFLHGRYTYLPLAGFMLLLSIGFHLAGKARWPLLAAGFVCATIFALLTLSQEQMWKDDLTVFTTAHKLAPHNAPVAKNLADAHVREALQLDEQGRCAEAVPVFEQVLHEYSEDWYAWAALGDCLVQLNNLPKAEESLHKAVDLSHDSRVIEQWQQLRAHMGLPNSVPSQ